jgi:hypothetical protein
MTPELKSACELVFQEHKISGKPINWNKDSFRGQLSFGMAAMAKQTLEMRHIICTVSPVKKTVTFLNPVAAAATNVEEAEVMIENKIPVLVSNKVDDQPAYVAHRVSGFANTTTTDDTDRLLKYRGKTIATQAEIQWWAKPVFTYIILPVSAAVAGGLITYLLGLLV